MKQAPLKNIISRIRNSLDWPVLERDHEQPVIRIFSDPQARSHIIMMPDKLSNRSSELDYLHELGHAVMCEKVHPIFAGNSHFASPPEGKRQFLVVIPALNVATDWFIGQWIIDLAKKQALEHVKESLKLAEEIIQLPQLPPVDIILDASLVIAQAIHYLNEPIDCGGVLQVAVNAFLSVPPDEPSVETCCRLVNALMATYTHQRARLVKDGGYDVWEVYQPEAPADECVTPS